MLYLNAENFDVNGCYIQDPNALIDGHSVGESVLTFDGDIHINAPMVYFDFLCSQGLVTCSGSLVIGQENITQGLVVWGCLGVSPGATIYSDSIEATARYRPISERALNAAKVFVKGLKVTINNHSELRAALQAIQHNIPFETQLWEEVFCACAQLLGLENGFASNSQNIN